MCQSLKTDIIFREFHLNKKIRVKAITQNKQKNTSMTIILC